MSVITVVANTYLSINMCSFGTVLPVLMPGLPCLRGAPSRQLGGLSEGVWQLSARATDAAGNSDANSVATGTWRYDPDPSKVSLSTAAAPAAVRHYVPVPVPY